MYLPAFDSTMVTAAVRFISITTADVTEKPAKALRRGRRIRKSTARTIERALTVLDAPARQSKRKERKPREAEAISQAPTSN